MLARIPAQIHSLIDNKYAGLPLEAVYADPGAPESLILRNGICYLGALNAVMTRPNKSPALLSAITKSVAGSNFGDDAAHATVLALLDEQSLTADALYDLVNALPGQSREHHAGMLTAICSHRLSDVDTILHALWNADTATFADVAAATRNLQVVAMWWVVSGNCREYDPPTWRLYGTDRAWKVTRARTLAAVARWDSAAETNPALRAYLLSAVFDFNGENETTMIAAGLAITADPTLTQTSRPYHKPPGRARSLPATGGPARSPACPNVPNLPSCSPP